MHTLSIHARPPLAAAVALLRSAALPTEDLTAAHCEHFFFLGSPQSPDALIGLELFGDCALLRSQALCPASSAFMSKHLTRSAK